MDVQTTPVEELSREHPLLLRVRELEKRIAELSEAKERKRPTGPLKRKPWMRTFLRVLRATGGNVSAAIRAVGRPGRTTIYEYKERCPEFSQAWDAALSAAARTRADEERPGDGQR